MPYNPNQFYLTFDLQQILFLYKITNNIRQQKNILTYLND